MNSELAAALVEGHAGKALSIIRSLPAEDRNQFSVASHEADLLGKVGRHEEELAVLGRLVARETANPGVHLSIANALKTVGRIDEAIAAAQAAIALRPGYGKAWWVLADLKTYRFTDDDIRAMESALAGVQSAADRQDLHFALGRAFEVRGNAETAFAHYAQGNSIAATANSPRSTAEAVERRMATFTASFFADRKGFGHDSNAPIFIVGLHRSGSTVVEQILASHPEIEATSELPVIEQVLRTVALDASLAGSTPLEKLASLDQRQSKALGAEYLERARDYRSSAKPRFVDKMPSNWLHLGLIQLILPNATVVDARRHPMAAGFSNFRQNYARGASWTFALESIGHYYRDYLRLMRHFDHVLPGKIHHIINERLIEDFEPEVRRLLDHVGVAFEPACLEFHRSDRPVRSASAEQVRRPISREGVDQWRAFEPWLGPLKEALGDALENWQE